MKHLKTYSEFNEATRKEWANRSAIASAALMGGVGAAFGGLPLAALYAAAGAIGGYWKGKSRGTMIAGGQARKDYKRLQSNMKTLAKLQKKKELTVKDMAEVKTVVEESKNLVQSLKTSVNSSSDEDQRGVTRSSIGDDAKVIDNLKVIENELNKIR